VRLVVRARPDKCRQKRMMDVDDPVRVLGQECRGENLHVAGQHHKIDPAPQQLEHLLFLSFFSSGLDGQVV